jgi:glycosyltransferase involved in cell wall biosynthesis
MESRLRPLLFYASEIDALGGAELSVRSLAEGLAERGHQPSILEFAPTRTKRRLASGILVSSVPRAICPEPYQPRSWLRFSRNVSDFLRIASEIRPEIVSVQFPTWQSPPVVAASALPHKWRLVVTVRGSDIRVIPFTQPRLRWWQRVLFERADAVTSVSQSLLRDTIDLYPIVGSKARVINNGLRQEWFNETTETPIVRSSDRYVLFVGALREVKGIDILLRAWQQIHERVRGCSLLLVGAGAELDNLVALSGELGVRRSVRFIGAKAQTELPLLYRNAQLVVIPSRNEGLPRVALEAGACGAICVGARVGGLPEVIEDRITGFLVEPESSQLLAEAILRVLNLTPEEREQIGRKAKERIRRHFSHEQTVASYERLFRSLL